jgi:hypothetical protein
MRRYILFVTLVVCCVDAHALQSFRVGNQLLVVGDRAAKVKELMGNPSARSKASSTKRSGKANASSRSAGNSARQTAREKGEQWQYWHDGHTTIFTIANGQIAHIEDFVR